jgi:hypothetical protein
VIVLRIAEVLPGYQRGVREQEADRTPAKPSLTVLNASLAACHFVDIDMSNKKTVRQKCREVRGTPGSWLDAM